MSVQQNNGRVQAKSGTIPDFAARDRAVELIEQGIEPIPVKPRDKAPAGGNKWGDLTYGPEDFGRNSNIGVHHVPETRLAAIDRDAFEAIRLRGKFLPDTRSEGRPSKPFSHDWYFVTPEADPPMLQLKDGEMLMELRWGRSKQTVSAPSVHPSGEQYVIENPETPITEISAADLERGVRMEAAAAVIARHYPPPGGQYDFGLHLAGFLLGNGMSEDDAFELMMAAKELQPEGVDKDAEKNIRGVCRSTARKIEAGDELVTGGKRLKEEYDEKLPSRLAYILGWKSLNMGGEYRKSSADDLVAMGLEMVEELFVDQYKQPYALVNGASVPVDSLEARLRANWFRSKGKAAGADAVKAAIGTLQALAQVEGTEHDLKTRWARKNGAIYYETSPGRVWEIDGRGWRLAENPPVRFRRLDMLRPLPAPVRGGSLADLTRYLKLDAAALRLYLAVMVSYPFENIPRPILAIVGEQGGGKTTRTLLLKRLLDEDGTDFVTPSGDVLRQATHRGIVAFDNQSSFPKDFADLLCSLVTGAGDSRRELYSNNNEFGFKVRRPAILNGINLPSDRPDLLNRTVIVEVPHIDESSRLPEARFWEEFEFDRGKLLGVVFALISGVLRNLQPLQARPRMADWAEIASALYEHVGWGRKQFATDWRTAEEQQYDTALDGVVGEALMDYLRSEPDGVSKTPGELHRAVRAEVDMGSTRFFPQSANSFSRELNRLAPALEAKGWKVLHSSTGRGKDKKRIIEIVPTRDGIGDDGDDNLQNTVPTSETQKPLTYAKNAASKTSGDDGDDGDGIFRQHRKSGRKRSRRRSGGTRHPEDGNLSSPPSPSSENGHKTPANGHIPSGDDILSSTVPNRPQSGENRPQSWVTEQLVYNVIAWNPWDGGINEKTAREELGITEPDSEHVKAFYTYLRALRDRGVIRYNRSTGKWTAVD
jgi:hypothetical protein